MLFFSRPSGLPPRATHYLDAPRPTKQTFWRDVPYSVLDIETSGLNTRRDTPLSIGLVNIDHGRVQVNQHWYSLVRPPETRQVSPESICVHHLMRADLARAPSLPDVLLELLERLRGRVLIVHVAEIDVQFLNRALKAHFGMHLRGPALDTARLARSLYHTETYLNNDHTTRLELNLRALAQQMGLPPYDAHHALGDALTTAQLFLVQATRFASKGACTLGSLLRSGGCLR